MERGFSGRVICESGDILVAQGLYWLDATVALVIALVVGCHALKLIVEVLQDLRKESGERSSDAR